MIQASVWRCVRRSVVMRTVAWGTCGALLHLTLLAASAAEPRGAKPDATAAELLPNSTVLYAEIPSPPDLVKQIIGNPLAANPRVQTAVQGVYGSPDVMKLRLGMGFVELGLGQTWQSLVENLTVGGVHVAIDGESKQPLLLVRAKDAESLERVRDRLFKLVRDDAKGKGQGDPIQSGDHRGITGYKFDRITFATLGPWLVLSQQQDVIKRIADAWLDGQPSPLAKDQQFVAARADRPDDAIAWAFVRLDKLRDAGLAAPLVKGTTDNPLAELLVGGLLSNLQKTPTVSAALRYQADRIRLVVSAPHDRQWVPVSRKFYFGPEGRGAAPAPLDVPGRLALFRAWRDIGGMWAAAPDLFDERVNGELAQANSNLSNVLGGKDFGQDVLESLSAELQFVAAKAQFEQDAPLPTIKLPAFGIVTRLRDAEGTKRLWKVMFQTLIGFVNIGGGMNGLPLFELESEKIDDVQLVIGRYSPPEKKAGDNPIIGLHYNFSPTLALVGDQLMIASNRNLAVDLAKAVRAAAAAKQEPGKPNDEIVNTELSISAGSLLAILADNRDQLIAQNMLEKGHDKAAAEQEINVLLGLTDLIDSVLLRVVTDDKALRLEVDVKAYVGPSRWGGVF